MNSLVLAYPAVKDNTRLRGEYVFRLGESRVVPDRISKRGIRAVSNSVSKQNSSTDKRSGRVQDISLVVERDWMTTLEGAFLRAYQNISTCSGLARKHLKETHQAQVSNPD